MAVCSTRVQALWPSDACHASSWLPASCKATACVLQGHSSEHRCYPGDRARLLHQRYPSDGARLQLGSATMLPTKESVSTARSATNGADAAHVLQPVKPAKEFAPTPQTGTAALSTHPPGTACCGLFTWRRQSLSSLRLCP